MKEIRLIIIVFVALCMASSAGAQTVDPCFLSTDVNPNFASSGDLQNVTGGTDLIFWTGSQWAATGGGSGINIDPPANCEGVRAAFLYCPSGGAGEGIGLRLNAPLTAGAGYGFTFEYASGGSGSDGTFGPRIYTSDNPELMEDGVITGNLVTTLPTTDDWNISDINFTASGAQDGDDWIFIFANESSGLILNFCYIGNEEVIIDMENNAAMCEGQTLTIGDPNTAGNITWNTGETTPTITVSTPGLYTVNSSNACNSATQSVFVEVFDEPHLFPDRADTTLCPGDILELSTVGLNTNNTWGDGSTDSLFTVTEAGTYTVSIIDDCASVTDQIIVDYDSIPDISLGADTAVCFEDIVQLDAFWPGDDVVYEWSNGSEDPMIIVNTNESATWTVDVTNQCGTGSDAIFIEYSLFPEDALAGSYEICFGRELILDVSHIEGIYTWKDGTHAHNFSVPSIGYYWVQIQDDDGCWVLNDTTEVIEIECACPLYAPGAFTPNDDGLNDEYKVVYECIPYDFQLDIYDRWGTIIYTITDPTQGWSGKVNGNRVPDGMYHYRIFYREVFAGIPIIHFGHIALIND